MRYWKRLTPNTQALIIMLVMGTAAILDGDLHKALWWTVNGYVAVRWS